ncbi:uncharacterized protein JCM15063_002317 [Sporobolomyces koalae]|uniref:uncharacterized protein n=1 Tax=Sporobolomyces koalae TaxID=500713 RepID=UPI00317180BF
MTTSSSPFPSTSASTPGKPHLSLSVGPSPRPPPSLASASPSTTSLNTSRRVASWGSIMSEGGLSALGERGMTPLPSPMDHSTREWGYLPTAASERGWHNSPKASWNGSHSKRWIGGDFGAGSAYPHASSSSSPFGPSSPPSSSSNYRHYHSPTPNATTAPASSIEAAASSRERTEPTRSKTLSFFDSSSPVIAPAGFSSAGTDPSFLVLSPPPNPPSRNNSLNTHTRASSNRPRSSSRLSISDIPPSPGAGSHVREEAINPLRSSTTSTSSWLDDFVPNQSSGSTGLSWGRQSINSRNRGTSIGSWSEQVNKAAATSARFRTETTSTTESEPHAPVERRLFMDLPTHSDEAEPDAVHDSLDRPKLAQLDTSFLDKKPGHTRQRSISNDSTGSSAAFLPIQKPLSALPTAVEATHVSASRMAQRFLHHHDSPSSAAHSYRDSPPPPIDFSQLPKRNFLAPDPTATKGNATPRTPPSMEELQKIIGGTTLSESTKSAPGTPAQEGQIEQGDVVGHYSIQKVLGKGAFSRVALALDDKQAGHQVALKLMDRKSCEGNERMRISVLREVEVLKNISHPSLVTLCDPFITPTYTVLVLDYCSGGELFDFLADHHAEVTEGLARRMFGELCDAVGWMHRVGLVHRDIKLENILLTSRLFPLASGTDPLEHVPTPFVKLTDFGLSRFINPAAPFLQTRCGSEAYAAPELLMGKPYDGRLTDSWAVGVVLYALVTGGLPFVEEQEEPARARGVIGGSGEGTGHGDGLERRVSTRGGRKGYLLKIAKAEYSWPATPAGRIEVNGALRELVSKLLVRDPAKRWRIDSDTLWTSTWMSTGPGQVVRVAGTIRGTEEDLATRRGSDQVDFSDSQQ